MQPPRPVVGGSAGRAVPTPGAPGHCDEPASRRRHLWVLRAGSGTRAAPSHQQGAIRKRRPQSPGGAQTRTPTAGFGLCMRERPSYLPCTVTLISPFIQETPSPADHGPCPHSLIFPDISATWSPRCPTLLFQISSLSPPGIVLPSALNERRLSPRSLKRFLSYLYTLLTSSCSNHELH